MTRMASSTATAKTQIKVTPKLAIPGIIGVVLLICINFFSGLTYTEDPRLAVGFAGLLGIFGLSHMIPKLKFGVAHAFYIYAYHWLLAFMLIFIVPTLSFYLYIWVLLLYLSEFYYGKLGTVLSSLAMLSTMVVGTVYQSGLDKQSIVRIAVLFIVLMLVNKIMTGMAIGNRKKRTDTINKVVHAEYEHDRLVALINSMNDAVIATDEQGTIITYNAAALDILDTNATLTGETITDYLKVYDANDKPVSVLDIAKKTDYIQRRTDLKVVVNEQESISLDINISRITKSTVLDRREGYTFLLRDITQQKNLDDEKDLFIHEVSHELRTPITVAEGEMSMAIMLAQKPTPNLAEIKHTIGRGHDQVVFLGEMINDLSALSRATQNAKQVKVEEFSIADIMSELEADYKPQAEKKGLYLKVELAPSIPLISTSRLYFKEILDNFITNAIKYTEKGGVTIIGQAIDKDHIMLSVADTGIGIDKAEQDMVYQKFWRSDDPSTRKANGTGLGLYVTRQLAKNIGAEVKLQSKLKVGSTFSLIISTKGNQDPISRSPIKRFFKFNQV